MADLKTTYAGLKLINPIIVGASILSSNADNFKRIEDAGAAAIVYKSLFEEQVQLERLELEEGLTEYNERHAEMITLFPDVEHAGPSEHLMNLRLAKESVNIPVIASLNCVFAPTWIEYAKLIQDTGVDALELNFFYIPRNSKLDGKTIIEQQIEILKEIKKVITIPVTIKLSPFYTNPLNVIMSMDIAGADGFVLFNRFLQPDIDPEYEIHINHFSASSPEENLLPMKFAGLLYGNTQASVCANTGIHSGRDVAKMLLAGADCVQIVSTLYKNKISYLTTMISDLDQWMDSKGYKSILDFKGKLSQKKVNDPFIYKRAQYIDILSKSSDIFKKYPLH